MFADNLGFGSVAKADTWLRFPNQVHRLELDKSCRGVPSLAGLGGPGEPERSGCSRRFLRHTGTVASNAANSSLDPEQR